MHIVLCVASVCGMHLAISTCSGGGGSDGRVEREEKKIKTTRYRAQQIMLFRVVLYTPSERNARWVK